MEGQGGQSPPQGGTQQPGSYQQPPAQHAQGQYHHGHGGGGGGAPGLSADQKAQVADIGWKLVMVAGALVAFSRFMWYLDFTDTPADIEFRTHLGFWSMWGGGLAMVALAFVEENQETVARVALVFFGVMLLAFAPQLT